MKLKIIAFLFPLIYILILLFQQDLSLLEDLGRHIKLGEIIVHCLCVPQTNLFSYVTPNFPVVSHEWLSEVIFYLTAHFFGLSSLLYLKIIFFLTTFVILYYLLRKQSSLFWTTVLMTIGISFLSTRFRVRPEMFSYFFISLFFLLIYFYKKTKKAIYLWVLTILELFWVNMHIFFAIGLAIYYFFLVDEFFYRNNRDKKLLVIGFILSFVPILNPSFLKGALLPFTIFSNYDLVVEENYNIFKSFSTMTNASMTLTTELSLFLILALTYLIIAIVRVRKELFYSLSGLIGTILGLQMVRNIGLFTTLSLFSLGMGLTLITQKISASPRIGGLVNVFKVIAIGLLLIFVYSSISELTIYKQLGFGYTPYAENAANFILQNHVKGPIFNNYRIGNYLIYKFYPKERVYVDARPEDYPPGFFATYNQILVDDSLFADQDKKYKFNVIIFGLPDPSSRTFLLSRLHSPDWIPVYADGNVTILLKNNSLNADLIKKYQIHF